MDLKTFINLLAKLNAIVTDQIFVYKATNKVGNAYVNKEKLAELGATMVNNILKAVVSNAFNTGFQLEKTTSKVAVIGPSYGAINYAPGIAEAIETYDSRVLAFTTRTELDRTDDTKHVIPSKLMEIYNQADEFIIIEDIVNNGTTIKQVVDLIRSEISKDKKISVFSLVDRGENNTVEKLNVKAFYPFYKVGMIEYDITTDEGIEFLNSGLKINTDLGKGKKFIQEHGNAPYSKDQFQKVS